MEETIVFTLSDRIFAKSTLLSQSVLIIMGSLLVGLLAQFSIPLPFTPVPITGQTLGVLLVGASLGSRKGALSLGLYLLEGCCGLPVFAPEGAPGLARLLGPTGGYLVGFVPAAFIIGYLAEKGLDRHWKTALPAFFAGQTIIFFWGVPWLSHFVGTDKALAAGLWPFLPGAVIKTLLAAAILPTTWKLVKKAE